MQCGNSVSLNKKFQNDSKRKMAKKYDFILEQYRPGELMMFNSDHCSG